MEIITLFSAGPIPIWQSDPVSYCAERESRGKHFLFVIIKSHDQLTSPHLLQNMTLIGSISFAAAFPVRSSPTSWGYLLRNAV
jgi:hypothetical protein